MKTSEYASHDALGLAALVASGEVSPSDLVEDITPQAASSYYLVVPLGVATEGSYGVASNGAERPVPPSPADRCLITQTTGGCN